MDESILRTVKIMFLLGFTLHNMEEALWLPAWSHHAAKFHKPVSANEFIFAVVVITMMGFILTVLDFLAGKPNGIVSYVYLGFTGMMGVNTIFPHLAATIALRKYAPGLITGLCLNLPLSSVIIVASFDKGFDPLFIAASIIAVSSVTLALLPFLFRMEKVLIKHDD